MTGTEIYQLMTYYGKGLPNYAGDSLTDAQALLQINAAIRMLSKRLSQWDSRIVWTLVAGTGSYLFRNTAVFSKKLINPMYVTINGTALRDASGQNIGLWCHGEAERLKTGWRVETTTGSPTVCVISAMETLTLFVPPDAATVSAGSNYVASTYLAADLAALSETPDVPVEFGECLAAMAAARAGGVMGEKEVWNRIAFLNNEWADEIQDHARKNASSMAEWRSDSGYTIPDVMFI